MKCLVNDLDLSVSKDGNSRVYYPNGLFNKDSVNNVERVIVPASDGDTMRIKVEAANLDRAEQPFALYLIGCFGSEAFAGDAVPQGQSMDRTTKIIISVCSVVGFLILLLVGLWSCDNCRRRKRREARMRQAKQHPRPPQSRPDGNHK